MIAKDPALVGGLLKLANSPFYRVNAQPVESVDRLSRFAQAGRIEIVTALV